MNGMEAKLMYIDADARLYRGYGREWPILVWDPERSRWTTCDLACPKDWGWGELVTVREAERCYPGSTTAPAPDGVQESIEVDSDEMMRYRPEISDFYDFGTSPRRSPDEIAERCAEIDRRLPEETRAILAKRKAEREAQKARLAERNAREKEK
jgi:hypothetical protein